MPDHLADSKVSERPDLHLLSDGSAREFTPEEIGTISEPDRWRPAGQAPQIDPDYRNLKVTVTSGGVTTRSGTLTFADLEPLPRRSHMFLLQCGAPNPTGIVKWTGVRFSDVATMLGVHPTAGYCRVNAAEEMSSVEDMITSEDIFTLQTTVNSTFHMTNPTVFYNREDQWDVPIVDGEQMEPYYTIMRLPGEEKAEFIQMLPVTPRGRNNLAAWMVARSDGEQYGKMLTFQFPKQ